MPQKGERSLALACINKIEPCTAYANLDTGARMAARQPKLCFNTLVPLAYCQLVVRFYIFDMSVYRHGGRGGPLGYICLIGRKQSVSERGRASTVSPIGRPDCLLLSQADLIVRVGDGGVQAQGSLGQPYFLTLVF